jgi:hypothetical protein
MEIRKRWSQPTRNPQAGRGSQALKLMIAVHRDESDNKAMN